MEFFGRGDPMSVKTMRSLSTLSVLCCVALLLAGCGREASFASAEKVRTQKVRAFCYQYLP